MNLTVWQRAQAANCLGQFQPGDMKTFRKASRLMDILEISRELYAEFGIIVQDDGSIFGPDESWNKEIKVDIADENDLAFLRSHLSPYLMKLPISQRKHVASAIEAFGIKEE